MSSGLGPDRRDTLAWRLSAALCLALVAGVGAGLHRWTHGFEVWTFEGRRHRQVEAGQLSAPAVRLLGPQGQALALWGHPASPARAYLVDFIYTRCPSVCRALGSEYQQMQRELAAQPAPVRLVSVSFDLGHDTPARLAAYAAEQHARPAWWTLAVAASPAQAETLLQALGVVVVPDGQGGYVHNGALHLLDASGRVRGLYTFNEWPQALAAARALAAAPPGAAR